MPKVALFNQKGSKVGEIELNDSIFGIEPNNHVYLKQLLCKELPFVKEHIKLKYVLK